MSASVRVDDLRFSPDPQECARCPVDGCDLTCVWDRDPLTWQGDNA